MLNGLLDLRKRTRMPGVKPMGFDGFAEGFHLCFIHLYRPCRGSRIVASLDDEHRCLAILNIGNGRTGSTMYRLFLWHVTEKCQHPTSAQPARRLVQDSPMTF